MRINARDGFAMDGFPLDDFGFDIYPQKFCDSIDFIYKLLVVMAIFTLPSPVLVNPLVDHLVQKNITNFSFIEMAKLPFQIACWIDRTH
jgi:hypothetical protein